MFNSVLLFIICVVSVSPSLLYPSCLTPGIGVLTGKGLGELLFSRPLNFVELQLKYFQLICDFSWKMEIEAQSSEMGFLNLTF